MRPGKVDQIYLEKVIKGHPFEQSELRSEPSVGGANLVLFPWSGQKEVNCEAQRLRGAEQLRKWEDEVSARLCR
jgi:hypothetical protein